MIGKYILAGNTSHLWGCEIHVCSLCGQHQDSAEETCPEGRRMMDFRISTGDAKSIKEIPT